MGIVIQRLSTDSSLFLSDLRSRHSLRNDMTVFHSSERSVALTSLRRSLDRARRPEGRVLGRPYCKILFFSFLFPLVSPSRMHLSLREYIFQGVTNEKSTIVHNFPRCPRRRAYGMMTKNRAGGRLVGRRPKTAKR